MTSPTCPNGSCGSARTWPRRRPETRKPGRADAAGRGTWSDPLDEIPLHRAHRLPDAPSQWRLLRDRPLQLAHRRVERPNRLDGVAEVDARGQRDRRQLRALRPGVRELDVVAGYRPQRLLAVRLLQRGEA